MFKKNWKAIIGTLLGLIAGILGYEYGPGYLEEVANEQAEKVVMEYSMEEDEALEPGEPGEPPIVKGWEYVFYVTYEGEGGPWPGPRERFMEIGDKTVWYKEGTYPSEAEVKKSFGSKDGFRISRWGALKIHPSYRKKKEKSELEDAPVKK